MGYRHTDNLYSNQTILLEPEVYATEKIHGTSARLNWNHGDLHMHGGGETHTSFSALFDEAHLQERFKLTSMFFAVKHIVVYGEAYGGKQQKNAWRYGPNLKFIVFEVQLDGVWQTVPKAHEIADWLGLEFVHYVRIETKLSLIDAERDAISEQSIRNGVTTRDGEFIRREGVVLRCIEEKVDGRGNRIIAKHKRAEERETKTIREVKPEKAELIKNARKVAEEFVVAERLGHVLDKMPEAVDMTYTRAVISAMIKDIEREGAGEFEPSPEVNAEIGKRTAQLFKAHLASQLNEVTS